MKKFKALGAKLSSFFSSFQIHNAICPRIRRTHHNNLTQNQPSTQHTDVKAISKIRSEANWMNGMRFHISSSVRHQVFGTLSIRYLLENNPYAIEHSAKIWNVFFTLFIKDILRLEQVYVVQIWQQRFFFMDKKRIKYLHSTNWV